VSRSEPSGHLFRPGLTGDLGAGNFDYILIDCPPTLGTLTVNALATVQEVLVPVEAHVTTCARHLAGWRDADIKAKD
jgi:Mrp family chromosome partitioning ATPase